MFWSKKTKITTKVTRTADEYQNKQNILRTARIKATKCPHCGHVSNNNYNPIGYRFEGYKCGRGFNSECEICHTKWTTEWEY